ncbi:kelch-like protein 40b [Arctopsyche grandis]|uniref:kelch-like protein 40b n=1 Tax=Arctopsyche grandis TaxID=121162 RepID=UPI00406D9D87
MFVMKPKSDFAAKRVAYLHEAMKLNKKIDTGFTVRHREINAHLIVLVACSEFFGIKEGYVEDILSDYDFEVIEAILKYCYTGEISIDERHFQKLMELANRLEVKIPKQFKTVDLSNCLEVLKLTYNPKLKTRAIDLILENFETLQQTQDSLELTASNVTEILKSDDLIMPSEEDVFNSVKLWVNHDYEIRHNNDLAELMSSVRLSLLSIEFLVDKIMPFCNSCAKCMISIGQAIKDNNKNSKRETPRRKKEMIALVGGIDVLTANTIDTYDGQKKIWTISKDIGFNKRNFVSVVVGNWIVIIGGFNFSYELQTSVE